MQGGPEAARGRVSPCCGGLIAAAIGLYVAGKAGNMQLCVEKVIYSGEGLRVVLAPLAHRDWVSLAGSCIGIGLIGPKLERCYGTAGLFCLLLLSATVCGFLYIVLSYLHQVLAAGEIACAEGLAVLCQVLIYLRTGYWEQTWTVSRLTLSSRCLPWVLLPLSALLTGSMLYAFIGLLVGVLLKMRVLSPFLPRYTGLEAFSRWRPISLLTQLGFLQPLDARNDAHTCLSSPPTRAYSLASSSP